LLALWLLLSGWLVHLVWIPRPEPLSAKNPLQIHWQPGKWPLSVPLVAAIDRAQHSLDCAAFSFNHPEIHAAWQRAAERGVRVRLRSHVPSSVGLPPTAFVEEGPWDSGLFHAKVMIVDEQEVWISSANFSADGLSVQANLLVGLWSESLAQGIASSLWNNNLHPTNSTRWNPLHTRLKVFERDVDVQVWVLPEPGAQRAIFDWLRSAQSSICTAQYVLTSGALIEHLGEAARRGVAVDVVLSPPERRVTAVRQGLRQLRAQNLLPTVWLRPSLCHHKMAWIDGTRLITGSANWTKAGWTVNREIVLMLDELPVELQKEMTRGWEKLRGLSRPMTGSSNRQLYLFAPSSHLPNDSCKAELVDGAHRCSTQTETNETVFFGEPEAFVKQVRKKTALGFAGNF
jgi:cardiolipin synthase